MSISLISNDGTTVTIEKSSTRLSTLLQASEEPVISLPEVDGTTLNYICEYLTHYKDINPQEVHKPLEHYDIGALYGEWDYNFMQQFENKGEIWKLLEAAEFMGCESLMSLATSVVAIQIKDYSGHELCEYFGLEEDLTEQEAKQYVEEYEQQLEDEYSSKNAAKGDDVDIHDENYESEDGLTFKVDIE
jgi:hypothetical protein